MKKLIALLLLSSPAFAEITPVSPSRSLVGSSVSPSTVSASRCLRVDSTGSDFYAGDGCGNEATVASSGTFIVTSTASASTHRVQLWRNQAGSVLGVVQQDGSFGIGTASPADTFHVGGTSFANLYTRYQTDSRAWRLGFGQSGGDDNLILQDATAAATRFRINTVGDVFVSGTASGANPTLLVTNSGTVGVGNGAPTIPATALEVNGDASFGSGATKSTFTASSGLVTYVPAAQTIAAGNTVTADACGGIKMLTSAGAVTTDTTNTFTAPAASNKGCCMDVILDNAASGNVTLDANASFNTLAGADVILTVCDVVRVCSNGSDWYQGTALQANTCN